MRHRVSIDPGREIGVAVWDSRRWKRLVPPVATGVVRPLSWKLPYHTRVEQQGVILFELLERYRPITHVYAEWPMFMESEKGFMAAMDGDLVKLTYCTGFIGALSMALGAIFVPVEIRDWKGQLPKNVVELRIRKMLGRAYPNHAADAVGIGLDRKGFPLG